MKSMADGTLLTASILAILCLISGIWIGLMCIPIAIVAFLWEILL